MIVCYGDACRFFDLYGNMEWAKLSPDQLVIEYRRTKSEEVFATLVSKTIGLVAEQAKKINNPDFTESDAYSHGIEILLKAIDCWDENSRASFTTFFTTLVHNRFDTLAFRSKQYRSYIHTNRYKKPRKPRRKKGQDGIQTVSKPKLETQIDEQIKKDEQAHLEVSLDNIIEASFDKFGTCDKEMGFSISNGPMVSPLANRIIHYLIHYNINRKGELAEAVGVWKPEKNKDGTEVKVTEVPSGKITQEQFQKELKELKKVLQFILV